MPAVLELPETIVQLLLDPSEGAQHALLRGDVVAGRIHPQLVLLLDHLAGDRIHPKNPLDLVAPVLDAIHRLPVRGEDLEGVALHAELAPDEVDLVSLVLDVDEAPNGLVERELDPANKPEQLALVLLG